MSTINGEDPADPSVHEWEDHIRQRDATIAALRQDLAQARARLQQTEAVLAELVALKRLKDGIEAADHPMPAEQREYESRKPAAWAAAFALVDAAVARQYGGSVRPDDASPPPDEDTNACGPRGTYGCACLDRDAVQCAAIRYGMEHYGEACQCLCHQWGDDDDDYH